MRSTITPAKILLINEGRRKDRRAKDTAVFDAVCLYIKKDTKKTNTLVANCDSV
jgi:hypothetical protein